MSWRLNVAKSVWGKHPKPSEATVTIEHREPSFKYSGAVTMQLGGESAERRSFSYEGAIDGKEYPVGESTGEGTAVLRRVSANRVTSERKDPDSEVKAVGPDGEISWTEIYDRQ